LIPLVPITLGFLGAALAAAAGPPELRVPAWWVLGLGYLVTCTVGATCMRSGILGPVRSRFPGAGNEAYLTFDDGPDPAATPAVLELLERRGASAAFFCVGERVRRHPDLVRRLHQTGHVVGNHSNRHRWYTNFLGRGRLTAELRGCQDALRDATGAGARFYRPPFGLMNHATAGVCRTLGLEVVGWQVRSFDRSAVPVEQVVDRVLGRLRPGGIILLHDGGQAPERIVAITEGVLDGLAARGLRPAALAGKGNGDTPGP
jgi:peptidoglycan/xylan/chitin deacetylase (PgdA/CDA1 family)